MLDLCGGLQELLFLFWSLIQENWMILGDVITQISMGHLIGKEGKGNNLALAQSDVRRKWAWPILFKKQKLRHLSFRANSVATVCVCASLCVWERKRSRRCDFGAIQSSRISNWYAVKVIGGFSSNQMSFPHFERYFEMRTVFVWF